MKNKNNRRRAPELTPLQQAIVDSIKAKKPLMGEGGVLTDIIKGALEAALEGEMESHLSQNHAYMEDAGSESENHSAKPLKSVHTNRRNGLGTKTIHSGHGKFELTTPRDRDSSFNPQAVAQRQTVLTEELDNKILALFKLGMSYSDISGNVEEMYGYEASSGTISAVTDKLIPVVQEWRARPLEAVYPIVFMDAMFFKTRQDNVVKTKVMYNIMGINADGRKEILGFYAAESEGANFWLGVLNDLRERGVKDHFNCLR